MAGPGSRPPWYVFALAVLGVLLILGALIGFGPRSASAPAATPEPVPQPYQGSGAAVSPLDGDGYHAGGGHHR